MKKILFFFLLLGFVGSNSANDNLINLGIAKRAVKDYYKSGAYEREMQSIIDNAILTLTNLKIPSNPAFVFDVDETSLSNYQYELNFDFGYSTSTWDNWVNEGKAPAIEQVKRFYDTLLARHIKVIFITGRKFNQYNITVNNLKNEGYLMFDTLICRSPEFIGTKALDYKSEIRKRLSDKYTIIGSIGDQWSDLDGGWTILKIKLPNYCYYLD